MDPVLLPPAAEPVQHDHGTLVFIGTATVLLRYGGFTVLTDPNFLHAGDHAQLGYGMTSPRLLDPALEIDELPPLDLCVLSHFHGDHWDAVATARLPKDLPVVTTPHAARELERRGFHRAVALERWGAAAFRRGDAWLRITAMPARHGPALVSRLLPPVMGSMLEFGAGAEAPRFRLYVSGDTLVHDDLRRIPERYPDVDAGLFHLGGTRVLGVLVTMDAAQGVDAIRIVRPRVAIPIHHGDYPVFKDPLENFIRAVHDAGLGSRVEYLGRGETYAFDAPAARPAREEGPALRAGAREAGTEPPSVSLD
jgi:L-ascorbate metabolism protein UlaG (beta-lactamase superfamily)